MFVLYLLNYVLRAIVGHLTALIVPYNQPPAHHFLRRTDFGGHVFHIFTVTPGHKLGDLIQRREYFRFEQLSYMNCQASIDTPLTRQY